MFLESLLSLSLQITPPNFQPVAVVGIPTQTRVIGAYTGSRSFSSSSFSRPSSSSFSRPSSSSFSRPSSFSSPKPVSTPKPISTPKPTSAPTIKSTPTSAPNVVRINKQTEPAKSSPVVTTTKNTAVAPVAVPTPTTTTQPNIVTRETYVERYNDSGPFSSPWFWMYMMNNNNRSSSPTPVVSSPTYVQVKDSEGKSVKVPENQIVVKKENTYNPIREFFVFALGGGIGVLVGRKFSY